MIRKRARQFVVRIALVFALITNIGISPAAAESLKDVVIPDPTNLHAFLKGNPVGTPAEQAEAAAARETAMVLGKALFWDMQVGSDDVQACASCHFNAGSDARQMGQLNPGSDTTFGNSGIPGVPGPNDAPWNFGLGFASDLSFGMFPFHFRNGPTDPVDPLDEFANVIRDTNDAGSSMGVRAGDAPWPSMDPIFSLLGANQRRVEPRNAPSMINAVLHVDTFWDGRASTVFNGVNPFGFRDRDATVKRNLGTTVAPNVQDVQVRIPFASHASQSVGPPVSDFEMAGHTRDFAEVGAKMLDPTRQALGMQVVHPNDSVLGPYAKAVFIQGGAGEITGATGLVDPATGLDLTYLELIQDAFRDEWWNGGAQQQHDNFSLFFGLAMQVYQGSLVADETPFDRFAGTDADVRGDGQPIPPDPTALTEQELLGLDIFQGTNLSGLNQTDPPNPDPLVGGVNGLCFNCHILPETSNSNLRLAGLVDPITGAVNVVQGGPTDPVNVVVPNAIIEAMPMGIFVPPAAFPPVITDPADPLLAGFGLYDVGFYNIGVRPTAEDTGRFAKAPATTGFPDGLPLAYVELADMKRDGLLPPDVAQFVPDIPNPFPAVEVPLADGTVVLVDIPTDNLQPVTQGAFKVPTLRNQEFQGPYFHNGGDATLRHVVEFYVRGGNFPQTNIAHLDPEIGPIPGMANDGITDPAIAERNIRALVAFLANGLTDPRVANGEAPFDHPQLFLPGGVNPTRPGEDLISELRAVGAAGGHQAVHFLGLDPQTTSSLESPGRISGGVVSSSVGSGLAGIQVTAHRLDGANWVQWASAYTDGGGFYSLAGLSPGNYRIRFADERGDYSPEIYDNTVAYDITVAGVTEVTVAAGATTAGINASLETATSDQFEPDDTMQTARLVTADAIQARSVLIGGNQDWIRIPARAGNTYTLQTSGVQPVDTTIEVYSSAGLWQLQNNDGGDGLFSLLQYTAPVDGDLFFLIRGANSSVAGPYTLTITAEDLAAPVTSTDAVATYQGPASIGLTASDDWSGVDQTFYRVNGGAWTAGTTVEHSVVGTHTLEFYSVDVAGNEETAQAIEFVIGALAPVSVAGITRYDTAVDSSREAYPAGLAADGAKTVVIATGANWPDALGGAALAGALDGPILLVGSSTLPFSVSAEIGRLGAEKIIVLGGTGAVSAQVAAQLASLPGITNVERIAGGSRYVTADQVALRTIEVLGADYDGTGFVGTGRAFPDALAAAPLAAAQGWPVFLVDPTSGVSSATVTAMAEVSHTLVLGGTNAVPSSIEDAIVALPGMTSVDRLSGGSRYETAVAIATYGVNQAGHSWNRVGIATGQNFPDALSGGVLQGKYGSVMLLTPTAALHAATQSVLAANAAAIDTVTFYGGEGAVSTAVRDAVLGVVH